MLKPDYRRSAALYNLKKFQEAYQDIQTAQSLGYKGDETYLNQIRAGADDIPQSSVGAPNPCLVATEHKLSVSFVVHTVDPEWDGTSVRLIGLGTDDEPIATVRFERPVPIFSGRQTMRRSQATLWHHGAWSLTAPMKYCRHPGFELLSR